MDRSSFSRVETTHDVEKRQAFKAKLASQIVEQESQAPPAPVPNFLEGTSVWHPDFGACTVLSVNEESNSLILSTPNHGKVDLVFSQIQSKLIPASEAPEHIPFNQALTPNKTLRVLSDNTSSRILKVQLPNEFKKWTLQNQFNYLTRNQHLTTDEANDVFAKLNGDVNYGEIIIDWQDPIASETKLDIVAEVLPEIDRSLVGKTVWHLDLGPATVLSVDSKFITLDFADKGPIEMVLSHAQPRLSLTEIITLDHASKYVVPTKQPILFSEDVIKNITVILPLTFSKWDDHKQYLYLTTEKHLTQEESNDVLSILAGTGQVGKTLFNIEWSENADLAKVEAANLRLEELAVTPVEVVPEIDLSMIGTKIWHLDFGVCTVAAIDSKFITLDIPGKGKIELVLSLAQSRLSLVEVETLDSVNQFFSITEQPIKTVKKEVVKNLVVVLPPIFGSWDTKKQYSYLATEKHLTPEESNDVLSLIHGKGQTTKTVFTIEWSENADLDKIEAANRRLKAKPEKKIYPTRPVVEAATGVQRTVEEEVIVKREITARKLSITLPQTFKTWPISSQYVFLTRTKQLTANEANDIIDILQGKQQRSHVLFEIGWDEQ